MIFVIKGALIGAYICRTNNANVRLVAEECPLISIICKCLFGATHHSLTYTFTSEFESRPCSIALFTSYYFSYQSINYARENRKLEKDDNFKKFLFEHFVDHLERKKQAENTRLGYQCMAKRFNKVIMEAWWQVRLPQRHTGISLTPALS